ncbi:MAG: lysine biosynthesis protein LysW [Phycisphaeraceae bacterium]|nr:lysine biosynthesis protein LysW [Phycisphaeraceae bacterium]
MSAPTPTATSQPITSPCPECEGPVRFDRPPLAGQVARCTDCGVELEVTSTSPLTLALAPEVEEDWGE